MGFLDKVKNMFTEEIDEEEEVVKKTKKKVEREEIKTEVTHVSIESPNAKKSDDDFIRSDISKLNNKIDESENIKAERNKKPIFFTDHDFEDLDSYIPKRINKKEVEKKEQAKPLYKETPKIEEKKFKPTPIISPVYGILDKNYHKEDIVNKKNTEFKATDTLTIDSVRNKAFGNLEEELENTLYGKKEDRVSETYDDGLDMFTETEKDEVLKQEQKLKDLEDLSASLDKDLEKLQKREADFSISDDIDDEVDDDLDDSDLFNLIDSMYEERDDD